MRIVITGATGFVGRHLLPMLSEHEIVAIARPNVRDRPDAANVSWITANLSDAFDTAKLPQRADAIIHLAQSDRYREFPAGALDVFRVNIELPAQLVRWAASAGVARSVFASTGSVYEPYTGSMREDSAVAPRGYYAASKLACEMLTLPYETPEFAVAQLRLFFIFGPGQGNSMLSRIIYSVREGRTVALPPAGDGLAFVPTYVGDVARMIKQATEQGWRGVWNVANPKTVTMQTYINAVGLALDRTPIINRNGPSVPQLIVPDLTKIAERTNLEEFVPLDEGIKRTIASL